MKKIIIEIFISSLSLIFISSQLFADDVDIFIQASAEEANVLFVMDSSGSMGNFTVPGTNSTRMQVMQSTLKSVLVTAPDYLSIGIMNYGSQDASEDWRKLGSIANGVKFPIKPINALARPIIEESLRINGGAPNWWMHTATGPEPSATVTVRGFIGQISDNWSPYGNTPIVDALYEAALYYRGETIKFGHESGEEGFAAHPATYVRPNSDPLLAVPPITGSLRDPLACNAVKNKKIINLAGIDNIQNWMDGNTGRYICPADPLNPASPGSASNCALTKHDCGTNIEKECLETFTSSECSAYDTDGYCTQNKEGECKVWGANDIAVEYCRFTRCETGYKSAPNYISPITGGCKSNNIILMSDGSPNMGALSDYPLTAMSTATTTPILSNKEGVETIIGDAGKAACTDAPNTFTDGKCGSELTQYLATHDNLSSLSGDQYIDTLVIGFSSGITTDAENYLKSLVTIEDDLTTTNKEGYYSAQNGAELAAAFNQALLAIRTKAENTYGGATYSSNSSTALTHDNYAYVAVFEQSGSPAWNGNLKKYEIRPDGKLYGVDATGAKVRATTDSGAFEKGVGDLWTTGAPSNEVTEGGAANKINPSTRNILTNNSSSIVNINTTTETQLGVSTPLEKTNLIAFIKGSNSDGTPRHHMGDIIHSKPVQMITSSTNSVIFVATNEGFVHAIQASTGEELFAFMPDMLLKNIKPQMTGVATTNHIYGIDGQITLWHEDTNHNGIKEATEKAYIYFGLRRGGQAYYALDVTTPASPELLWTKNNLSSGYENLGFTWSTPKIEMLRYKTNSVSLTTQPEPVLIFGGGYINDKITTNLAGMGVGAYIVNATDGSLLESYTHAEMGETPGAVRAVDTDRNGSVDRLYFADTKANIWRVDLDEDSDEPYNLSKDKSEKITQFAELGGTDAHNRSFFSEPDVAVFKNNGISAISIAIGSGLRPDPLSTDVDDYFFMLLDENVFNAPPASHPTIVLTDLLDAPVTGTDLVANLRTAGSKKGWKKTLGPTTERTGEKVLSAALTYQNKVLFTTFSAKPIAALTTGAVLLGNAAQSCASVVENTSKFYALDILTGGAALDLNSEAGVDDSWVGIGAGKIPTTPQIRYDSYTAASGRGCTENDCVRNQDIHAADRVIPLAPDRSLPRVYWRVREN
ncbi:MAG: hypothetical protein L3J51_03825 [Cocleimonas sp.]|nr:hypothetical protein [Cocleimonas sp.]